MISRRFLEYIHQMQFIWHVTRPGVLRGLQKAFDLCGVSQDDSDLAWRLQRVILSSRQTNCDGTKHFYDPPLPDGIRNPATELLTLEMQSQLESRRFYNHFYSVSDPLEAFLGRRITDHCTNGTEKRNRLRVFSILAFAWLDLVLNHLGFFAMFKAFFLTHESRLQPPPLEYRPTIQPNAPALI
jgi:hypothetical protein